MPRTITWRMPTSDEARKLGLDDDQHKDLAAAAVAKIEDAAHPLRGDAAKVAQSAGLTLAQARSRRP